MKRVTVFTRGFALPVVSRLTAHYGAVRSREGFGPVDFGLGDATAADLSRRYAAVYDRDVVSRSLDRPTLFCTGIGMTGPPHVGSLAGMYAAIELQELGADVQFVLADLEPYHSGFDLASVRSLARRYREFLLDLGFDPEQGTLRTQEEARDVMHTAQLLAPYYTPEERDSVPESEPTEWEVAVREAYEAVPESERPGGPTSEAASVHSGMLHLADFCHPLREGYEQVVVLLGADEHHLSVSTARFLDDAPVEGSVGGLHSRMIPGPGDCPKVSKGIPDSGPSLDMSPETIREAVHRADADGPAADSPLVGMLRLAGPADDDLDRLLAARADGDPAWDRARDRYAEFLADHAERWAATA